MAEDDYFYISNCADGILVPKHAIISLETVGNQTQLIVKWPEAQIQKFFYVRSIIGCLKSLNSKHFFRINRQVAINLNFVKKVYPHNRKCLAFTLHDGREFILSRSRTLALKKEFKF